MRKKDDNSELSPLSLENKKKELEILKLEYEIEQIRNSNCELTKKWYKKPQWIMSLSPIIVGLLTLLVAWSSGFLQAQASLNKIQEEKFERRRDSINKTIRQLTYVSDSLKLFVDSIRKEKELLSSENIDLIEKNRLLSIVRDSLTSLFTTNNEKINSLYFKYATLQQELLKKASDEQYFRLIVDAIFDFRDYKLDDATIVLNMIKRKRKFLAMDIILKEAKFHMDRRYSNEF